MSTPEHRRPGRHTDARLWLVVAFTLGALLAGSLVALLQHGDGSTSGASSSGTTPRSAPTSSTAPTPSASPTTSVRDRVSRAEMTKPLTDLAPGDRVVFNMQLCRFRHHIGDDPEVSLISCPGDPPTFQVRTMELVPVEASSGD